MAFSLSSIEFGPVSGLPGFPGPGCDLDSDVGDDFSDLVSTLIRKSLAFELENSSFLNL